MKARVLGFALACLLLIVFLAPQSAVWAAAPTQRIAVGSEATCVLDSSGALYCTEILWVPFQRIFSPKLTAKIRRSAG